MPSGTRVMHELGRPPGRADRLRGDGDPGVQGGRDRPRARLRRAVRERRARRDFVRARPEQRLEPGFRASDEQRRWPRGRHDERNAGRGQGDDEADLDTPPRDAERGVRDARSGAERVRAERCQRGRGGERSHGERGGVRGGAGVPGQVRGRLDARGDGGARGVPRGGPRDLSAHSGKRSAWHASWGAWHPTTRARRVPETPKVVHAGQMRDRRCVPGAQRPVPGTPRRVPGARFPRKGRV